MYFRVRHFFGHSWVELSMVLCLCDHNASKFKWSRLAVVSKWKRELEMLLVGIYNWVVYSHNICTYIKPIKQTKFGFLTFLLQHTMYHSIFLLFNWKIQPCPSFHNNRNYHNIVLTMPCFLPGVGWSREDTRYSLPTDLAFAKSEANEARYQQKRTSYTWLTQPVSSLTFNQEISK